MKLKQRIGDFRVRELLDESYLVERGEYRLYRVTKRKLNTSEAVDVLAQETGVPASDVGVAGWKDRQAITIQYMSVHRGPKVRLQSQELKIDTIGFGRDEYSSAASRGNGFELNVRGLSGDDLRILRRNMPLVREHGLIDYFDDQRFGNLTHGQGWIVKDLMLGEAEKALKTLLAARSPHDDEHRRHFKTALEREWGNWRACRDVAGKFGAHHSVFEHLQKQPEDFAGAFTYVASRVRLIHLYAWQSHLWNRAVCEFMRTTTELEDRVLVDSEEGALVSYREAPPLAVVRRKSFRLPGEGLDDVEDEESRKLLADVLAGEGMVPDQLRIGGVSGFQLKGEDRELVVRPRHLRVRPAEADPLNRGARMVRLRFELPRGSYASLVVKRLFTPTAEERERREQRRRQGDDRRDAGVDRFDSRRRGEARARHWEKDGERDERGGRGQGQRGRYVGRDSGGGERDGSRRGAGRYDARREGGRYRGRRDEGGRSEGRTEPRRGDDARQRERGKERGAGNRGGPTHGGDRRGRDRAYQGPPGEERRDPRPHHTGSRPWQDRGPRGRGAREERGGHRRTGGEREARDDRKPWKSGGGRPDRGPRSGGGRPPGEPRVERPWREDT